MVVHRHDVEELQTPGETASAGTVPPAGPDGPTATGTSPAPPVRRRHRARATWLVVAGVACLVAIAAVLGVRSWDLDGQVSDLTDENGALDRQVADLTEENSSLTAERDSIREIFPISQETLAAADLEGTFEFALVPVPGACTYVNCDEVGAARYPLSIGRTSDGYALALEGVPGSPAPMSQAGNVYSASGVLPESLWGTCNGAPSETSFELQLSVVTAGLAGTDLRAAEATGTYREYTPYEGLSCAASESSWTFTARRTG